jgi:hypothetical protein
MLLTRAQRVALSRVFNHHRPIKAKESASALICDNGWSLEQIGGAWAWTHPIHGVSHDHESDIAARHGYAEKLTYAEFRRKIQHGRDCVMIHVSGIWIGIEADGYAHS